MMHASWKRLVQTFHQIDVSVFYDRVCEVKISVARSVCKWTKIEWSRQLIRILEYSKQEIVTI